MDLSSATNEELFNEIIYRFNHESSFKEQFNKLINSDNIKMPFIRHCIYCGDNFTYRLKDIDYIDENMQEVKCPNCGRYNFLS